VATAPDQTLRAPVFYRSIHRGVAAFGAPVLTAPAESENGTYGLSWTGVTGAVGYRLQQALTPNTVLLTDDAESGLGKWTAAGTTPLAWSSSTQRAQSPTHSFLSFQGPSQDNTLTLKAPVTVPAGQTASLAFWTFYDTEPTFDFLHVEASRDGARWSRVLSLDGNSATWVRREADLSSYAGGPVYVRFRYVTDIIGDAGLYEGAYVDDITIATADWRTIAEPATTSYSVTNPAGTYYHRVAGLFNTADVQRAQGPFSNTASVIVQANQVGNGSFENVDSAAQPNGWSSSGNTRANNDPALATDGVRSVSILGTGTATGGSWTSSAIAVKAGQQLTVKVDVVGAGRSSGPVLRVNFVGAAGALLSSVTVATGVAGSALSTLAAAVTVPADTTALTVTLLGFAPTDLSTSGTVTFDNVRVY
jgi:hypothetical protein